MASDGIVSTGDRVEVYPNLHHPDVPSGLGTVLRTYVQSGPGRWQHVYAVRLDDGRSVDAPSRFVVKH